MGLLALTTLVERVTPPLPSKELVKTGVHCANGKVTVALCSRTNGPFAGPLVALKVRVELLTAMWVMVGAATIVLVMSRTCRRLICGSGLEPVDKGFKIKV